MLIAVISDTHMPRGGRHLPEPFVERIAGADLLVHGGDFVTVEVLRELERIGPPLVGVHGNVDEPALRRSLPATRTVDLDGVRIGLTHDGGRRTGRLERLRRSGRVRAGRDRWAQRRLGEEARRGRAPEGRPCDSDRADVPRAFQRNLTFRFPCWPQGVRTAVFRADARLQTHHRPQRAISYHPNGGLVVAPT
jgi:hypothetical protein